MTLEKINVRHCGKWILAGEHAVLRGGSSLIFPLKNLCLDISYIQKTGPLKSYFSGTFKDPTIHCHCIDTLKKILKKRKLNIEGEFYFNSTLPLGYGLGGSAAFSVAISRLFERKNWISKEEVLPLALELENEFHGTGSGADVHAIYLEKPIVFNKNHPVNVFEPLIHPHFFLMSTKKPSLTYKCVQQVQSWCEQNPKEAVQVDAQMNQAVQLCITSLTASNSSSLELLQKGMELAKDCFIKWGLCSKEDRELFKWLQSKGALACKPTGSGMGGMVVALFAKPISFEKNIEGHWIQL